MVQARLAGLLTTVVRAGIASDDDTVRLARAGEALERAVGIDPRQARAACEPAAVQLRTGAVERAKQLPVSAVENQQGFVDAHYVLGELPLRMSRASEAREQFEQALREDDALSRFGMARLPMARERLPELSEGEPTLEDARQVAVFYVKQYFPHLLDR